MNHPDLLDRATRLLAATGPGEPSADLADRVARAAMASAPRRGLLERWFRIAVPTALVATAAAVALTLFAARDGAVQATTHELDAFELAPPVSDGVLAMEVD